MNEYKVSFSMFSIDEKYHFSNCHSLIKGETFDDALTRFKAEKVAEGYVIGFAVEGDMFNVTLIDKDRMM